VGGMVVAYFNYYPGIFLERLRNTKVTSSLYSCSSLERSMSKLHGQLRRSFSADSCVNKVLL
jgi:hypothetical protein